MYQEEFNIIFEGLKNYWINEELNNPLSIFYKSKQIEKEFKKLCHKSGGVTLKILKAIKFSIIEKGKCYYSQRELAKYFKVSQSTVKQSMQLIERILQTKFIPFPKNIINNQLSKHCSYRQMLIPPSLYMNLSVDSISHNMNLSVEDGNLSVETKEPECIKSWLINNFQHLKTSTYIPIYNTLYTYGYIHFYSLLRKEKKYIWKETSSFCEGSFSSLSNNKEKTMKHKLIVDVNKNVLNKKKYVVDYKSYGIDPKKFMNHVEIHRVLYKWLEILIENNVVPKIENTKMFLSSWNNYGNPRFIKHRINTKAKTFKLICIALTYRMWSEKINIDNIEKAIENFNTLANKQGRLLHTKKLDSLLHFLWNSRTYGQKDYFKLCILDENIVLTEYYNKDIPPQRAFERVRKMFGVIFYSDKPEYGKEVFKKNYKKFIEFTNNMVNNHRTKEMGKFGEYENVLDGFTDYIKTYFEYVYKRIEKSNSLYVWNPNYILGLHGEFVLWLSHQKGWENFMKDKKVYNKPPKYRLFS